MSLAAIYDVIVSASGTVQVVIDDVTWFMWRHSCDSRLRFEGGDFKHKHGNEFHGGNKNSQLSVRFPLHANTI